MLRPVASHLDTQALIAAAHALMGKLHVKILNFGKRKRAGFSHGLVAKSSRKHPYLCCRKLSCSNLPAQGPGFLIKSAQGPDLLQVRPGDQPGYPPNSRAASLAVVS